MPYKDKSQQRAAQRASQKRIYHSDGGRLREYHRNYIAAWRAQETLKDVRVARDMAQARIIDSRPVSGGVGYIGRLTVYR